jgi:hypothetical protein
MKTQVALVAAFCNIRLTKVAYWMYQNFILFVQITVSSPAFCLCLILPSLFSLLLRLIHLQLLPLSLVKESHEFDIVAFKDKIS